MVPGTISSWLASGIIQVDVLCAEKNAKIVPGSRHVKKISRAYKLKSAGIKTGSTFFPRKVKSMNLHVSSYGIRELRLNEFSLIIAKFKFRFSA